MTVSQKASLSLLISVFLFAIFTVISFMGLFDLVETRFYNPSITKNVSRELEQETRVIEDFIDEVNERFSAALQNEAVKRSFLPNQSAEDIFERSRLFGTLMESLGGLQSVRFIDAGGRRIHYSTLPSDVFFQDRLSISYRNYNEESEAFSYSDISVSNQNNVKLTLDSGHDRILLSLPFYDSYNVFRGTALFSLSVRAVSDRLLNENLIKYGEDVSIISNPGGVVIGMPKTDKDSLMNAIVVIWNEGITTLTPLDSENGELSFALISDKTDQGIFTGKIVEESLLDFPFAMKIILLVSFFLTTYLIIFLLFNLKQDSMTVVQNRLRRFQINLFEEFYERKGDMDWSKWSKELELRREEVRNELKRGIKIKASSRNNLDIDTLIDKSWNEMASVMNAQSRPQQLSAGIDEDKLSSILNKVLAAAGNLPPPSAQRAGIPQEMPAGGGNGLVPADDQKEPDNVEEIEEAEPLDEIDELEEMEELEELDEEAAVSLDDADDAADTGEVLEEIEEAEPLDESGELNVMDASVKLSDENGALSTESAERLKSLEGIIFFVDSDDDQEKTVREEAVIEEASLAETSKPLSADEISRLASEIEFSNTEEEKEPLEDLDRPLEIYSPFDKIIMDTEEVLEAEKPEEPPAHLEEINVSYGMSLVYKPFQADASELIPELEGADSGENVECVTEETEKNPDEIINPSDGTLADDVIIEERDGVNYIRDFNVDVNTKNIDAGFMDLVESVLKKNGD